MLAFKRQTARTTAAKRKVPVADAPVIVRQETRVRPDSAGEFTGIPSDHSRHRSILANLYSLTFAQRRYSVGVKIPPKLW